ncbi:MAG: helix-turn-helix domain-containing protein [Thermoanaerobaculia bacterium]|nr:helix-turn-helix domain-containing protein [Thermoanaerobaculia bacterium]
MGFNGDFIKEVREQVGLTQSELGKILGVSQSRISQVERGRTGSSAEYRLRVASLLDWLRRGRS